jgi:hypothetical protein
MDAPEPQTVKLVDEVKTAFAANDADRVRAILDRHPQLKALINQPTAHHSDGLSTDLSTGGSAGRVITAPPSRR